MSSNDTLELLDLPRELVELILIELYPLEIVKCRELCKSLLGLIDESIEIRLRIELAVDGLLLNRRGKLPATVLLDQVLERRSNMENLKWARAWSVACPDTGSAMHEIVDGIWSHCTHKTSTDSFRGMHYEELVSPEIHSRGRAVDEQPKVVLEQASHSKEGERWTLDVDDLGIAAADYSFNVAENVQILMEMSADREYRRLHFRTLSTNANNPTSAMPFLDIRKEDCAVWEHCSTMINGDYLLLMFTDVDMTNRSQRGGACVVSWRTASVVMPYRATSAAGFLDKKHILLMMNGDAKPGQVSMHLYTISDDRFICDFILPFTGPVRLARFLSHPISHNDLYCPTTRSTTFISDPGLDIMGALFYTHGGFVNQYVIVISIKRLLEFAQNAESRAKEDEEMIKLYEEVLTKVNEGQASISSPEAVVQQGEDASLEQDDEPSPQQDPSPQSSSPLTAPSYSPFRTLEWNKWGFTTVRWFPPQIVRHVGFRSVSGSRIITMLRRFSETGHFLGNSFAIYDFNPRPIRRQMSLLGEGAVQIPEDLPQLRRVTYEDLKSLKGERLLSEAPIPSLLPFRSFISHGLTNYHNYYLDTSTIIARTDNAYDVYSFLPDPPGVPKDTKYGSLCLYNQVEEAEEEEDEVETTNAEMNEKLLVQDTADAEEES